MLKCRLKEAPIPEKFGLQNILNDIQKDFVDQKDFVAENQRKPRKEKF